MVAAFKRRARAISIIKYNHAKLNTETAANCIFGIGAERITHAEREHVKVNNFATKQKLSLCVSTAITIYRQMNHPAIKNRNKARYTRLESKRSRFFRIIVLASKTEICEVCAKSKILIQTK